MAGSHGEITLRATRADRSVLYIVMGVVLATCVALGSSVLVTAHTFAPRNGMSSAHFLTMAVTSTIAATAAIVWLILLIGGTHLGSTHVSDDGLLMVKPCRRRRFVPWSEIDSVRIDALSQGKDGRATMGLRASKGTKGFFLPGVVAGGGADLLFKAQVDVVTGRQAAASAAKTRSNSIVVHDP